MFINSENTMALLNARFSELAEGGYSALERAEERILAFYPDFNFAY